MLQLGRVNIFLNGKDGSNFAIPKVLEFFDLSGKNFALFHDQNSKLKWGIKSKRVLYQKKSQISDKILENIFNLDLIVIEGDLLSISEIKKITNIPIILVQKDHTKFFGDVDKIYDFWKSNSSSSWYAPAGMIRGSINPNKIVNISSLEMENDKYIVSDVISGWEASLSDLITKWRRDFKINQILGGDQPGL